MLFGFADRAQVDAELLAFFVEMTAFEAEGLRGVGHVMVVARELVDQQGALEGFDAFGERAGARGLRAALAQDRRP